MQAQYETPRPKVLAVASGGGHWVQLLRLRPALADCDVTYACSNPGERMTVMGARFRTYVDGNKSRPFAMFKMVGQLLRIVLETRPDVIVSTGAAGGVVAIAFGRLVGARGLFIDSVANAATPSLSARLTRRFADATLSQWADVAEMHGLGFRGSVL